MNSNEMQGDYSEALGAPDASEGRSTGELIEVLGDDMDRCFEAVMHAIKTGEKLDGGGVEVAPDYEFHARQFIRSVLAFFEGASFTMRVWAVAHLMRKDEISDEERWIAMERRFELEDNGHIAERTAKITLTRMIKFTFTLMDRLHGVPPRLDTSNEWWSCLQQSIRVRDRLMHPRQPSDLDVSVEEVIAASKAEVGFRMLVGGYPNATLPPLE
ncbi:MAG: hypothetical protein WDO56_23155 [Gammaproteobacteria bacterium]